MKLLCIILQVFHSVYHIHGFNGVGILMNPPIINDYVVG